MYWSLHDFFFDKNTIFFNIQAFFFGIIFLGTSKNSQRHPELVSGSLVSASPQIQEIDCVELRFAPVAGQARNDGSVTKGFFRSPLLMKDTLTNDVPSMINFIFWHTDDADKGAFDCVEGFAVQIVAKQERLTSSSSARFLTAFGMTSYLTKKKGRKESAAKPLIPSSSYILPTIVISNGAKRNEKSLLRQFERRSPRHSQLHPQIRQFLHRFSNIL